MADDWPIFVDPHATPDDDFPPPVLRLPSDATPDAAAVAAEQLLRQIRWLEVFHLAVGDRVIGLTSRTHLSGGRPVPRCRRWCPTNAATPPARRSSTASPTTRTTCPRARSAAARWAWSGRRSPCAASPVVGSARGFHASG
jgi:hypothetical protein